MKSGVLRAILRTHLLTTPNLPPVEWEQAPALAPAEETWLQDELRVPVTTVLANGLTQARGLYLLTLHTPPDRVLPDIDTLADDLARQFEPGRTLTDAARSHQLELTSLDIGALRRVEAWGYRRCAVAFTAIAFRTLPLSA